MASLAEIAASVLELAREEARRGYEEKDERRVRDAAEKAWLAATQATNSAMEARGQTPSPGRGAHQDRYEFLHAIGRRDLARDLAYFSENLHGGCFYEGRCPTKATMDMILQEVDQYIETIKKGVQPRGRCVRVDPALGEQEDRAVRGQGLPARSALCGHDGARGRPSRRAGPRSPLSCKLVRTVSEIGAV